MGYRLQMSAEIYDWLAELCDSDPPAAVLAAQALDAEGFFVPAIRPPTVPQGKARLRVTLSARHEEADVERLLNALARAIGAARTQR